MNHLGVRVVAIQSSIERRFKMTIGKSFQDIAFMDIVRKRKMSINHYLFRGCFLLWTDKLCQIHLSLNPLQVRLFVDFRTSPLYINIDVYNKIFLRYATSLGLRSTQKDHFLLATNGFESIDCKCDVYKSNRNYRMVIV